MNNCQGRLLKIGDIVIPKKPHKFAGLKCKVLKVCFPGESSLVIKSEEKGYHLNIFFKECEKAIGLDEAGL